MADSNNNTPLYPKLPIITRFKLRALQLTKSLGIERLIDFKSSPTTAKRISNTTITTSDVHVDASRNLWFRLFSPRTSVDESLPLIVYFHGGGFASYSPNSKPFDNLCSHLAANVPAVVASVNYRLTPEYRYPAPYEDAFDALKFIDEQNYNVLPANVDFKKCFIGGDSAGGNIAHHVTIRCLQNGNNPFYRIRLAGVLALQPFFGGEGRTESELRLQNGPLLTLKRTDEMWRLFLPEGADRNHPAAHVFNSEDLKNVDFPSSLVIIGCYDLLQDWDRRYVEMLRSYGKEVELIEYSNAFHGFYGFPEMPEFDMLIKDVKTFVQTRVSLISS